MPLLAILDTAYIVSDDGKTVDRHVPGRCFSAVWPGDWINRLLFVRGLSAATKVADLRTFFPDAEELVVCKNAALTHPRVSRKREKAAIAHGYDG